MTNIDWFTSDLHFGHENIIRYCKRPYKDSNHMTEELISNWNKCVKPGDNVYVVGDFSFLEIDKAQVVFDRLQGNKHLVRGNHDKTAAQIKGWVWIRDLVDLRIGEDRVVLCHYPMRTWNRSHHGSLMLHGHTHNTLPAFCNQSLDVGVDCWGYRPVCLTEIKTRLKQYPPMGAEFDKKYGRD